MFVQFYKWGNMKNCVSSLSCHSLGKDLMAIYLKFVVEIFRPRPKYWAAHTAPLAKNCIIFETKAPTETYGFLYLFRTNTVVDNIFINIQHISYRCKHFTFLCSQL